MLVETRLNWKKTVTCCCFHRILYSDMVRMNGTGRTLKIGSNLSLQSLISEMASAAHRRLMKDYKDLQSDCSLDGISAAPDPYNLLVWRGVICGPLDTPWEGGVFILSLAFQPDYPSTPPTVKFLTKIFHPNGMKALQISTNLFPLPSHPSYSILTIIPLIVVYADGSLCLDILQKQWSSAYTVGAILTSIQSLLPDPNPNSPANATAAKLFVDNKKEYYKRVVESVEGSWTHVDM